LITKEKPASSPGCYQVVLNQHLVQARPASIIKCFCQVLSSLLMYLFVQADWPTLSLSSGGIFSISTFALSLLLVFRTNSSYEVRDSSSSRRWTSRTQEHQQQH
jgi:predicted membrane chloride channel (bestrophin family)